MSTDRYTKTVLTVIAIALSVIAIRTGFSDTARAMGDGCGGSIINPCYIQTFDTINVDVKNWPLM